MINKYKKRLVIIEAIQYTKDNLDKCLEFIGVNNRVENDELFINTLEGKMKVCESDYIIRGIHNEFYPCKEDIFLKTYELV